MFSFPFYSYPYNYKYYNYYNNVKNNKNSFQNSDEQVNNTNKKSSIVNNPKLDNTTDNCIFELFRDKNICR